MSKDMNKLAADVPAVMHSAATHMRKLASSNVELVKRAEAAEHENRVMKIARLMDLRGLHQNLSFEEKVASLRDLSLEKLATTEAAIELAAGGVRMPQLQQTETGHKTASERAPGESDSDPLEDFIESQAAFTS